MDKRAFQNETVFQVVMHLARRMRGEKLISFQVYCSSVILAEGPTMFSRVTREAGGFFGEMVKPFSISGSFQEKILFRVRVVFVSSVREQ